MMDWISEWLKQVILIILLAAFVDLLLPGQAMQRYVRTVVSLFLLLTLLTPVFQLFSRGWDADRMMAEAERLQTGGSGSLGRGGPALQSLEAVLASSQKLKEENAGEAKALTERQLAEEMKSGLEKAGQRVADIAVRIDTDQKGTPVIGSVQVVLSHREDKDAPAAAPEDGGRTVAKVQVEAVKPVVVSIGAKNEAKEAAASPGDKPLEEDRAAAVRYLEKEWQVPRERVSVGFAPSGGETAQAQ